MQIYIRRENEDFGPYSREAVLEYVKQGVFKVQDRASYAGTGEWKPLGELLGIAAAPGAPAKPGAPAVPVRKPSIPGGVPPASVKPTQRTAMRRQGARRPWAYGKTPEKKKGIMIVLNLALMLVVAGAVYVRLGGGGPTVQHYLAQVRGMFSRNESGSTDESAPAPAAETPAPVMDQQPAATTEAPAAPEPTAASTPLPPKPFNPADLAGNPAAWPKTVKLKGAVNFPIMLNGQVAGSVTAQAGSEVKLLSIQGDQLVLDYNGGTQTLPWTATDFEEAVTGVTPLTAPASSATTP